MIVPSETRLWEAMLPTNRERDINYLRTVMVSFVCSVLYSLVLSVFWRLRLMVKYLCEVPVSRV